MHIERLGHFVLTVRDIDATSSFYQRVLGMSPVTFGSGRRALVFGQAKINLHPANAPLTPYAQHPIPGSADLCFITPEPPQAIIDHLHKFGITFEEGPIPRIGALGPITSVYFRDPDGNLIAYHDSSASRYERGGIALSHGEDVLMYTLLVD